MHKIRLTLTAMALATAIVSCGTPAPDPVSIIPAPVSISPVTGSFVIKSGMSIAASETLAPAAAYLSEALKTHAGVELTTTTEPQGDITLKTGLESSNPEAYTLTADSDGVTITGASDRGVVMGIASLRALLPLNGETCVIPQVTINDEPRFSWRGMMLDVSRHFYTIDQVKDQIDLMATYKLNKFHWHLTDDQGWRIEIKQYPDLVAKGAWRKFDSNDRECMRMAKENDNPDFEIPAELIKVEAGDTLYGGYYTQDQVRDVVAYAAARGIDVIPEIDMPGHFMAAMHGYPDVSCFGTAGWGSMFSSPICPGKDASLEFAKNVYSELFELFPYEYVHLGADEVEKTNWKKCPACQARMKSNKLKNEEELQAWFVHQMEAHFTANSRKLIGWDEITDGGISPTATITWWRDWAPKAVTTATAQGNKVIICPDFLLYFDFIEGKRDLERIYTTEPTTYRADWNLSPEQAANIMGVQANIWCERIPSVRRMQYQIMPRILALSEMGWAQPSAKNWEEFHTRFVQEVNYWDKNGFNYRLPDFGGFKDINVFVDTAVLTISNPLPNVKVRYTTDGSMPQATSPLYTEPLVITQSTNFTFRGFRPDGTAGDIQKAEFRKESYLPAADVTPTQSGLEFKQYEYKGRKCAEIEQSKLIKSSVVDSVAIPQGVQGWLGLVYTGYVECPADGIYTFALSSNDGSMLYVDGAALIDNDGPHGDKVLVAQRALAKGWHKLRVEFFDMNNGGSLYLRMATPSDETLRPVTGFKH